MSRHYRLSEIEQQDFVKCWNEEMPFERMQSRFHRDSVIAIQAYAAKLRKKGYSLINRQGNRALNFKVETERVMDEHRRPTQRHPWKKRKYLPKKSSGV